MAGGQTRTRSAARRARGFTLVELMVVVAVTAILAGIAAIAIDTSPDLRSVSSQVKGRNRSADRLWRLWAG